MALLATATLTWACRPAKAAPVRAEGAGCGGVVERAAAHWDRGYRPPLALGDSTMLLALGDLARLGFSANAHGCRQYPEALSLLAALAHGHELPRLVVIALGANGEIHDSEIERALRILGASRLLVLLTPRELGGGAGADARLVRAEGRRHPERIRVLDWVAYSAGHPGWFEGDGLHLTPAGSLALARLIGRVVPLAAPERPLPEPRCAPGAGAEPDVSALALDPPGGTIRPGRSSPRVRLTVSDAGALAAAVVVRLREAARDGREIAAVCASVPADGRVGVGLTLTRAALADLSLRGHYRVRVEFGLIDASGARVATTAASYLLARARA